MILYQQVYTDSVSHFQHPNPDFFIISMLLYCLAFTESKISSTHFILSLFIFLCFGGIHTGTFT